MRAEGRDGSLVRGSSRAREKGLGRGSESAVGWSGHAARGGWMRNRGIKGRRRVAGTRGVSGGGRQQDAQMAGEEDGWGGHGLGGVGGYESPRV